MPEKPTSQEEEYFKQEELAKLRRLSQGKSQQIEADEQKRLKELHWMHCPKCGMDMEEVEFRSVKVDTCFHCDGMFLDSGELEKILTHKEGGWFQSMASHLFGPGKS